MFDALMSIAWRVTYGISTFTLKNRWAAFVGHTHAASVRFVLPRTVYTWQNRWSKHAAASACNSCGAAPELIKRS